jgi:hypothetical protein
MDLAYQTAGLKLLLMLEKFKVLIVKSQYTFVVNFSSDAYNINGKVNIEAMPEVNEKNSIDYVELLKESMNVESEN